MLSESLSDGIFLFRQPETLLLTNIHIPPNPQFRLCKNLAHKIRNAFPRHRAARFRLPFWRELVVDFIGVGEPVRAQDGVVQPRFFDEVGEGAIGAQYFAQWGLVNADG